jgi:hypothetical protein
MHATNIILASYLSILYLIALSCNGPALAQPMMTGNNSNALFGTLGNSISGGSGNGSNGMNLGIMNFANIFNSSSLFGSLGMSMVDGVKVTGVNVLSNNDVSVTLKHITTNSINTTLPAGVTVTAIRVPMNLKDLISAVSAVSNSTTNGGGNNVMNMMTGPMQGFGATKTGNSTSFMSNPFVFLKTIQIGSSSIASPNWKLPQSVTMGLVGMIGSSANNRLSSSTTSPPTADFIIVSVIPFTGKSTQ